MRRGSFLRTLLVTALAAAAGTATAASPEEGRALFFGARRAVRGAAPCAACHALGGEGPAFAASLGPDLSHSFDGLAAEAVDGMLQDPPFPTMVPIYSGHALTDEERAHLAAFLTRPDRPAAPGPERLAGWAAAIAAACIAGMALAGRRIKGSTRARLAPRSPVTRGGTR